MTGPRIHTATTSDGKPLLRIEGPLVMDRPHEELVRFFHQQEGDIVLDLGAVTGVNTIGMAALLELLTEHQSKGRQFSFLAISPPMREMLQMVP